MNITVPLNKLLLSPRNVRKTNGDEDIESLADSIGAKGLLQNLVVSEAGGGNGLYEVDAGGRRYRALQLLAKRKTIPRNWPVPVLVVPPESATEASLAENLQKIAMNPADEVEAFAAIIGRYEHCGVVTREEQVANCARRFGVTVRHVEQRLRLAALAPDILSALRTGRISLDAAKAYASHPDHEEQLRIFKVEEKKPGSWAHSVQAIKDALRGRVYAADHRAALYVGLDAYRAAGGRVEADLFLGSEEREQLLDPSILDRLVAEKASAEAQQLAQAAGYLDGVVRPWNAHLYQDPKPPKGFTLTYQEPPKKARGEAFACLEIKGDGSGLAFIERWAVTAQPQGAPASRYVPPTPEELAAERRKIEVRRCAVKLAMPPLEGTPLEERAFWPADPYRYVPPVNEDAEGNVVVALLITIPKAEIESVWERAEWEVALAEQAAATAAEVAAAADGEGAEPEAEKEGGEGAEPEVEKDGGEAPGENVDEAAAPAAEQVPA